MNINVKLPDGNSVELPQNSTPYDVAASIGAGLAKAAIGARVNGTLVDVTSPITSDCDISIITAPRQDKKGNSKFRDTAHQDDALYLLRHSTAHVMAEAIANLWPDTELAYGPPLETGFYYDIKLDTPISSDDFAKIEAEMAKIIASNRPFKRYDLPIAEGMDKLKAENNKYKIDNAERAIEGGAQSLSWYVTGDPSLDTACATDDSANTSEGYWEDLCQGPHVPNTSLIGASKVMSIASSNWHGDVNSDRFQRVYGTAFFSEKDLETYLGKLEEAKARDHRVIGQKLGLFAIDDKVGQGLVLWKPKGGIIRDELQKFIGEHLTKQGYFQVFTPHIGKLDLYRTSGHFPYYQDSQFPPIISREQIKSLADEGCSCSQLANMLEDGDVDGYMLKPMNCPHHIQIYASEKRSYRDLPIRLAEFGTVYRWEQSGELNGMTRVRGFTQDDAHLFVMPEQLDEEVQGCLDLVKVIFETLGLKDFRVRVSLRDPDGTKYVGNPEDWDRAESACIKAAESLGVPFSMEPGEAAFYGPKIDFVVKDVIGREWQLGTVQVDYQLPQRFELSYVGSDNAEHTPIMIHRAPFGSMERFVGVLIEHFNGSFPLWLNPEQVRVLPISDKFVDYAEEVKDKLFAEGVRVTIDKGNDRLNGKIKVAQEDRVCYMLVVGRKDKEAGTVSVRHRSEGDLGAVPTDEFVANIVEEIKTKALGPLVKASN
ncbi:Threonine--tRNA ligase [Poriferisphaera corsica]|uniref:Threonine--tRNA ligase n=1 Tax=Poriferisphaera corsica TaxID=2528020 RepID=A0A517YP60_9BACT|nr:threonine--tRNA ligase [Poriferisphaera corsica]QDU32011.1 Threonine--tRNA ligase [Poriferisphaera corsica]